MDLPTPSLNVALLIDADNASARAIDPVLTVLAELGTVNIRRAYGNWSKPALKTWAGMTLKHAIEPYQQFDLTKGKNATDMKMTIDAMDLLFSGRVGGFGIMSSDSDFTPLVMRIKQQGLPVYGFGNATTPDPFQKACTRFIDVVGIETPDMAEDADRDIPLPEEVLRPATNPSAKPLDAELLKLLFDAYNASKRDDRGYVSLSALGQLAGNRSSFDVRSYGYKRLSDLMAAIPNFQSERREAGTFVKRVR